MHNIQFLITTNISKIMRFKLGLIKKINDATFYPKNVRSYVSEETINYVKKKDIYTPAFLKYLETTKNSSDARDCIIHRGIQTSLKKKDGYNSPRYDDNCDILHEFDDM